MRIGIDISQVVYQGAGSATYTGELLKAMVDQDRTNDYVLFGASVRQQKALIAFSKTLGRPVTTHFPLIPPTALHVVWNTLHKIPVETFVGQVAIFHASDATQPPAKNAKLVTTVHDMVAWHYPETLHPAQVKVQKLRMNWVKKEAAHIIAVSEATKQDLVELLQIEPSRITVVYEGVSNVFRPSLRNDAGRIASVKQKYHIIGDYLLNVGTLQPRKNLKKLLEAYKELQNPPQLIMAGNLGWGDALPHVRNAKSIGFVDAVDLPYLYAGAKLFVYPSLYEGFGLPVLEAMACGTPVVTSNTSSLAEIGAEAAVLIDPNDAASIAEGIDSILSLTDDGYKMLQEKSVEHTASFSWQKAARETIGVYEKLK